MSEEFLEKVGLTKGEAKVYAALNRLGESTVGPITNDSMVSKSKIYDILEKLIDKGLVGYISKDGAKHFFTHNPKTIIEYIDKKEEDLKITKEEAIKLLPQFVAQRNSGIKKRLAEIYEGYNGLRVIREELLNEMKTGETLLVLGAPTIANEKWEKWLLNFHKKRNGKNIVMKILYNADAKKYGQIRKKMKNTFVKYLPEKMSAPNWIDVFPNAIMIGIVLEKPVAFIVRDKFLAQAMTNYFEIMWQQAKP
ncbi:MAG: helix-turn-helix domain-containing protein [archaeon]